VATHDVSTHPFPAQERVAQTILFVDRVLAIVDRYYLTTSVGLDGQVRCGFGVGS
jgi:hypothetical protein